VVGEDLFSESSAASDAEADAASGGVNPSTGEASSSKQAAPEEEILEISSDVDEDFAVAPSRWATEEEEDEDDEDSGPETAARRREPRSKAIHDKDAGNLARTPLKRKAEAAPEESSAGASSGLRRSSNKMWVDTRAKPSGYVLSP
jgi:hypothetical protein